MMKIVSPKLSVVIPCYGVEAYLDRCVESVLAQGMRDMEIILVDDGSPDCVPQMCDAWAERDARIKVVHQKNAGLGYARNTGLDVAIGEYVAFVDSDDYIDGNMYPTLYEEAVRSNADAVFSNFYTQTPSGSWRNSLEVTERMEWVGDNVKDFILDMVACEPLNPRERAYQMSVWHSIYKRSMIEEHHIRFLSEREILSEDLPFQIDFLLKAQKIVYIPEAYYRYCLNASSLTHSWNPNKFERVQKLYDHMSTRLSKIENAQPRLDKFYIGYMRARVLEMLSSDVREKKKWLSVASAYVLRSGVGTKSVFKQLSFGKRMFCVAIMRKNLLILRIFATLKMIVGKILK